MKLTLYLAVLVMLFGSCKKDSYTIPGPPPPPPIVALNAHIYPTIYEPRFATLGDPSTIFSVGERATVYVQYEAENEQVSGATLSILDEMGDVLAWYDMSYTNDVNSGGFSMPQEQQSYGYYSATIDINEQLAGKTLTLRTQVSGSYLVAADEITNAFSVNPY